MKFQISQTVIVLDTEYKPAGTAVIRSLNEELGQYELDFRYPDSEQVQQIWVREERLLNERA